MKFDDTTRTSPTLLRRAADWRDHDAWRELVSRYDPYFRSWCREDHLDDDLAAEVCQQFWIELADKMRTFRYDPSRRFRGWLRTLFRWRVIDAKRARTRGERIVRSLDDPARVEVAGSLLASAERPDADYDEPEPSRLRLLELGEQVQSAVRERIHARSWQAFWHIAIDGWTTRKTADALNMSYLAAHVAYKRVVARLAKEGDRRLAERLTSTSDGRPT